MLSSTRISDIAFEGFREEFNRLCEDAGVFIAKDYTLCALAFRCFAECESQVAINPSGAFDEWRTCYQELIGCASLIANYGVLANQEDSMGCSSDYEERLVVLFEECVREYRLLAAEAGFPIVGQMFDRMMERSVRPVFFACALRGVMQLEPFDEPTCGSLASVVVRDSAEISGKDGGVQNTPDCVCTLIARLARSLAESEERSFRCVYDPCFGLGSLALSVSKELGGVPVFGQDSDGDLLNSARMRLVLDGRAFDAEGLVSGDVLTSPGHKGQKFDVVVSHAPSRCSWQGEEDKTLACDERFARAGVLAPRKNADLAFLLHGYSQLADDGVAFAVVFPGALRRPGAEATIRRYLVEQNAIDAVIQLPPRLFADTHMSANIVVLRKRESKACTGVLLINVSCGLERLGALPFGTNDLSVPQSAVEAIGILAGNKNDLFASVGASTLGEVLGEVIDPLLQTKFEWGNLSRVVSHENLAAKGYSLLPSEYASNQGFSNVDTEALKERLSEIPRETMNHPILRAIGGGSYRSIV